jgi:hypothetical protein
MIDKETFLSSLEHEIRVIRHLSKKITPEMLEYRPSPSQRSILELLQYLSYVLETSVESVIKNDGSIYKTHSEAAHETTLENFDDRMHQQTIHIREMIGGLSDEAMGEMVTLWVTQTRAMHFLNSTLKWSVAYKMQLFQYLKQGFNLPLNTSNLWAGMDPKE